jgi:hypothetical protein
MLPAARWNTRATLQGETREHEASHAVAAHLLGFELGEVSVDRWADYGHLGLTTFRWTGPIDEELSFARGIVAAAGPLYTDAWELERSRPDRAKIEEVRWPEWSRDAWAFVVIEKTRRLIRSEPFRSLHRRVVAALENVGEVGTLTGDELRQVLVVDGEPGAPGRLRALPTQARP